MSRMKAELMAALLMAECFVADQGQIRTHYVEPICKPDRVPPSGCKEYFFNRWGRFSTDHNLKRECVFMCFAINGKNAVRKFKKWALENPEKLAQ